MDVTAVLGQCDVMAFAPTCDQTRAIEFYRGKLGLKLTSADGFAAVFDANGIMLRVTNVPNPLTPQRFTILGWKVADIAAAARALSEKGVSFERYPGITQDELGVWTAPGGTKVAWFRDPDGNILSLTQL